MSKKRKNKHKYGLHPIHLHFGVWVSVLALVITAFHASSEAIHAVYSARSEHYEIANHHTMREAREHEVHIAEPSLLFARRNTVGGR